MLTELLIPEAFKDNMWFNIAVLQIYISIFVSIIYFGKELIVSTIEHVLHFIFNLIAELFEAFVLCLRRIIQLPIDIAELLVTQHFPLKANRVKILNALKDETDDSNFYNLIENGLLEAKVPSDLRRLEKSIIQYNESRQYILENIESEKYSHNSRLSTIECL